LEQPSMAREAWRVLVAGDMQLRALVDTLFPVRPFDRQPLLLEQAFIIGDEFRQSLEGRGGFQKQFLFHALAPHDERGRASRGDEALARFLAPLYSVVYNSRHIAVKA